MIRIVTMLPKVCTIQVVGLCAVAPLKDVTHDAILPADVTAGLERLSLMNITHVKADNSDVVGDECMMWLVQCQKSRLMVIIIVMIILMIYGRPMLVGV